MESFLELVDADPSGGGLPAHVRAEMERFLKCGILAHGFVRVRCSTCKDDLLVAFSCKGRGFCPSCGGRRMADTAARWVDRVLPDVPWRQWVLTVPRKALCPAYTLSVACTGTDPSPGVPPEAALEAPAIDAQSLADADAFFDQLLTQHDGLMTDTLREATAALQQGNYLRAAERAERVVNDGSDAKVRALAQVIQARALAAQGHSALARNLYKRGLAELGGEADDGLLTSLSRRAF